MLLKRLSIFFVSFFHFLQVFMQLLYGVWKISKLPTPIVTIFGSSRLEKTTPCAKKANQLATMFTRAKISVFTGGGPGIMEAANCGTVRADERNAPVRSIGIGVT